MSRRTTMVFYHFTAREYLRSIAREGLRKGEVALSPTVVQNAVWLTTDPDPAGHGLGEARQLTMREKQILGFPLHSDVSFPNKRAIRFRTDVDPSDEKLTDWPGWAEPRLDRSWYRTLHETGGRKSETWWLYWGTIPPEALEATDLITGQPLAGWPGAFRPLVQPSSARTSSVLRRFRQRMMSGAAFQGGAGS